MPCLIALLAFFLPRVVIVLLVLTGDYIGRAYQTTIWPLLGFFFMPYTTLAFATAQNEGGGLHGWWLALFVAGILLDLSSHTGGERARRKRLKCEKP
ncbi:MAG: hypothetical protein HBSAPP03_16330 [Phycisphaerae bacterium]|nr:MAG: hypothetical protein HBSAPP03_16330 [Phycisphaerae bacterium]